jgi:hypothetical protein
MSGPGGHKDGDGEENMMQSIRRHLFANADTDVYAVLDGASIPNLIGALRELGPEYECLFTGELEPGMAEVVPYLVHLPPDASFTAWVMENGWGKHWGIYATSEADTRAMRQHFRSLLMVYDPDTKPLYFRYYDPRVLRVYLPTCNAGELQTVFGPVEYFLLEDRDPNVVLRFTNVEGQLSREKIVLNGT